MTRSLIIFLLVVSPLLSAGLVSAKDLIGSYDEEGHYIALLPWYESFDNFNDNYDGTSQLPNGWLSSGDTPFTTAYSNLLPAITGTYYMVTPPAVVARDDRAYTPFFRLEGGKCYSLSFYLWMPGDDYYHTTTSLEVTVGQEQDKEFHTQSLLNINNKVCSTWTKQEVTFTPTEDGLYCFCFHISAPAFSGHVGIEDVSLMAEGQVTPPVSSFCLNANVNLMQDDYMQFPYEPLQLIDLSSNAETYEWDMPGCIPENSTEACPDVYFPSTGYYTITLTVRNASGEHSSKQQFYVGFYDEATSYVGIRNYQSEPVDKTILRGSVPTYATDPINDFVTGPNHYYRTMAERYEMPEYQEIDVYSIAYQLTNYSFITSTSSTPWPVQKNVPVTVSLVGEKDGLPDETQVFGTLTGPMSQMVADRGIGLAEMKEFRFPTPVHVKGTFYVVLEFGEDFIIDTPDANIGRSYFAIAPSVHRSGLTTMYVKPHHDLQGQAITPTWQRGCDFSDDLRAMGLAYFVMCSMQEPDLKNIPNPYESIGSTTISGSTLMRPTYTLDGRKAGAASHGIILTPNKKIITR